MKESGEGVMHHAHGLLPVGGELPWSQLEVDYRNVQRGHNLKTCTALFSPLLSLPFTGEQTEAQERKVASSVNTIELVEELELNPRALSIASYQRGWPCAIEEAQSLLGVSWARTSRSWTNQGEAKASLTARRSLSQIVRYPLEGGNKELTRQGSYYLWVFQNILNHCFSNYFD